MALPIWGMYMKSCYKDKTLNVSKEDFEKPANLSIEVDCEIYTQENPDGGDDTPLEEDPDGLEL